MRSFRILLTEGNEVIRHLTRVTLESMGHQVEVVSDGLMAAQLAITRPYDLIVIDFDLPRAGGLWAAEFIRRARTSLVPILLGCSGAYTDETLRSARRAGVTAFLPKPARRSDFAAAFSRIDQL